MSDEDLHNPAERGRVNCCLPPTSVIVRFFVLFCSSTFFFTCTAVDDLVSAVVPTIKDHLHLSSSEISVLYSSTPVAAILASLATSLVVGKISIRTLTLASCVAIILGNTIFIYAPGFWPKVIGRAIFGIGEGPLEVLMTLICMRWFTDNDPIAPSLEFSFGVTSAAGMLGAAAGLNGIPWLLEVLKYDVLAYSIVNFVPLFALVLAIIYWNIDYWAMPLLERDTDTTHEEPGVFVVIKSLSAQYWLLFLMCGTLWSIIYVIMVFLTDYLVEKWGYSNLAAGRYASLVFLVGTPVSIITGWFVGRKGKVLTILVLGASIFTVSCLALGLTHIDPLFGIIGIGVATGFYEPTVFTSIAKVLPEEGSDTAYTFTSLIFQFVLFCAPFGFGVIHDKTDKYDLVFVLCSVVGILNVFFTMWLGALSPDLQDDAQLTDEQILLESIMNNHAVPRESTPNLRTSIFSLTVGCLHLIGSVSWISLCVFLLVNASTPWLTAITGDNKILVCLFFLGIGVACVVCAVMNYWLPTRDSIFSKIVFGVNVVVLVVLLVVLVILGRGGQTNDCGEKLLCDQLDWLWICVLNICWLICSQFGYVCVSVSQSTFCMHRCCCCCERCCRIEEPEDDDNELLLNPEFSSAQSDSLSD